jgi:L-fucose mutarotase
MLKNGLLHPEILRALGEAGHGAQILIADGNYPLVTRTHPGAHRVYLNLTADLLRVTDVLVVLTTAIPIEAAHTMVTPDGEEPSVVEEFRRILPGVDLQPLEPFKFYEAARGPDLALAIATGERRTYANIILTIGAVPPPADL